MSLHLKRLAQPRRWKLPKKMKKWAPTPSPGPHAAADSLPLLLLVRDELKLADRAREARSIITKGLVHVDGVPVRDTNVGVGLMDVVSIPSLEVHFRVLYDHRGRIALVKINKDQAGWKLCRIEGKTVQKKGRIQLNLHDGRNLVVKEGKLNSGDVLRLKLPTQDATASPLMEHFAFQPGASVFVTGGSHTGELAKVKSESVIQAGTPNRVALEGKDGTFETVKPYAFVVGKDKPVITIPEVAIVG